MPVTTINKASRLRIQFIDFIDGEGRERLSSRTYSSVKPDAADESLYSTAAQIASVQEKPVKSIIRIDEKELIQS